MHLEGLTSEARPVSGYWGPTSLLGGSVLSQLAQSTDAYSPQVDELIFPLLHLHTSDGGRYI